MKRPLPLWILLLWLVFLAFGGLYGGIAMLIDPSGDTMGVDVLLPLLPVPDFILPGLFLIFGMGLAPLVLVFGLLARPNWAGLTRLPAGAVITGLDGNAFPRIPPAALAGSTGYADWLHYRHSVRYARQRSGAARFCLMAFGEEAVSLGIIHFRMEDAPGPFSFTWRRRL